MELPPLPTSLPMLLVAALLIALIAALSVTAVQRLARRGRLRAQGLRAREGETRAETLLRRAGWTIEDRQASIDYGILVDGAPTTISLRADYLVRRDRARFVAEVKTGKLAPRIETSATRRQLLEYRIAFDVDGVLLVDAESERIATIEFPRLAGHLTTKSQGIGVWFMGVVFAAAALAAARWW